ncbi:MAG: coenzyme synthesis [Cereibacter sp.]|jgi:pyrroloquinoline quinone biosynthesis protein D|nr:coenzyme synthesis [Cereibacter sp.]
MSSLRSPRPQLRPEDRPILARHARLRFDKARDRWILLVPEKVMVPDEICIEILRMCDGAVSIAAITATLDEKYTAPPGVIAAEVLALLQDLADKGFVLPAPEAA